MVSYEFIDEYDTYLRGLYLHGSGYLCEAMELYTEVLLNKGSIQTNFI